MGSSSWWLLTALALWPLGFLNGWLAGKQHGTKQPRPTRCIFCQEPLPVGPRWTRPVHWLLGSPPPFCRDAEACRVRWMGRVRRRTALRPE